jgi:hypothetical protein
LHDFGLWLIVRSRWLIDLASLVYCSLTIICSLISMMLKMPSISSRTLSRSCYSLFRLLCIIYIIWIICASLSIFDYLILRHILLARLIRCISSKKITWLLPILNLLLIMSLLRYLIWLMLKMIDNILVLWSDWNLRMLNIIWMRLISLFLCSIYIHMRYRVRWVLHIYIVLLKLW